MCKQVEDIAAFSYSSIGYQARSPFTLTIERDVARGRSTLGYASGHDLTIIVLYHLAVFTLFTCFAEMNPMQDRKWIFPL
jgi:hypothetical protein